MSHSCPYCLGWGYITGPGASVPYSSTWVNLPDETEPCSHCIEKGLCPKCGEPIKGEDEDCHCSSCGWKDSDPGDELDDWSEPDDIDWEY